MLAAGETVKVSPAVLPENQDTFELWELVSDQVFTLDNKTAKINLAAVCPVITMFGLQGEDAVWMLKKIKTINEILNGGKLCH